MQGVCGVDECEEWNARRGGREGEEKWAAVTCMGIDMLALNAPLVLTKVGAWPVHLFQHGLVLRRAVARVACRHRQRD